MYKVYREVVAKTRLLLNLSVSRIASQRKDSKCENDGKVQKNLIGRN